MYSAWTVCSKNCGYGKANFASQILIDSDSKCPNVICMYLQPTTKGRIMCKYFGNISQLETRPLIRWPSESTNQRPGFQLTYASKTLAHDPAPSLLTYSAPWLETFSSSQVTSERVAAEFEEIQNMSKLKAAAAEKERKLFLRHALERRKNVSKQNKSAKFPTET